MLGTSATYFESHHKQYDEEMMRSGEMKKLESIYRKIFYFLKKVKK